MSRAVETEIVRASEMREKVLQRIWDIRTGEERRKTQEDYDRELARYEKQKGKRREITINTAALDNAMEIGGKTYGSLRDEKIVGYFKQDGVTFVPRPPKPQVQDEVDPLWYNRRRQRIGGQAFPAHNSGLLADAAYNRDIRSDRVEQYVNEMAAGQWIDLLTDPIAITTEGQVLNGQHRLAAVADSLYDEYAGHHVRGMGGTDPAFLIVWNVDPREALYADGSHRTAHDEKTIAVKLVKSAA